jgi:O-antigen ligase
VNEYLVALFISVIFVGISILIDISKTGFALFLLEGTVIRYGGIYENPNYVGLLLLITIPINIALFFRKYKQPGFIKFGLIILLLFSIVLLFVSNSRSSIVGSILASLVTLVLINKKIFFRCTGILVLVLMILFVLNQANDYLSLYFRLERMGNREYFWNAGLEIIMDNPFFGIGPELFDKYFFSYMPSVINSLYESSTWVVGRPHPHNFFLLFTAENGLLGLVCAIYFFILFFYISIKTLTVTRNNKDQGYLIVVAIIGIGVGIFFRAFFEVTGIITYGFVTRDLPLWIPFLIVIHIYNKHCPKY